MNQLIDNVINGGYCIGCGACAYKQPNASIQKNELELLEATIIQPTINQSEVCPFSTSKNEDDISHAIYGSDDLNFEHRIGYYNSLYAGKITDDVSRKNSSSGGLTTWLLTELMESGEIDGVIHVGSNEGSDSLFGYSISYSILEVKQKTKSRYYPTSFNEVLEEIDSNKKKYAFVGVPCYIKAVRLLCIQHPEINNSIKYFIGIFCGHMKSGAFAQLLAWQQGIPPEQLRSIDFRVKTQDRPSTDYSIEAQSLSGKKAATPSSRLYGTDWGLGFFKPKACEWCDDISAETADVVFGDAWLPEYTNDSLGTNIVITRNKTINSIFENGLKSGKIVLTEISEQKIIQSQAANYRHRRDGLLVRAKHAQSLGIWHPKKRLYPSKNQETENRSSIYLERMEISEKSHTAFKHAKKKKSLTLFTLSLLPLEIKYFRRLKRNTRYFAKNLAIKLISIAKSKEQSISFFSIGKKKA